MKNFITIISLVLTINSFSQGFPHLVKMASGAPVIDSSVFAIMPYDSFIYYKGGKPVTLEFKDWTMIDSLVEKSINEYNLKVDSDFEGSTDTSYKADFVVNFKRFKYRFQLIPLITINGEKTVKINSFCSDSDADCPYYWKNSLITVADGGSCYFNLAINLTTGKVTFFYVNESG